MSLTGENHNQDFEDERDPNIADLGVLQKNLGRCKFVHKLIPLNTNLSS